ncbi:uncharacterized protein LOC134191467 [Corticium candelabrum]|uniref:uncharacterized protein LOC134191467 n=1 Tax=Corticium candelabrum TaxID=121492 RepID=UPI002E26EFFC|nr:uncharacterized protein LOC134191467 [Corticium candelabrum]
MFVSAMVTLNGLSVTLRQLDRVKCQLDDFYRAYERLYGIENCTMNVHLLTHLPDVVRRWGMLWAYSCFWFEYINGQIRNHVHGTRYVTSRASTSMAVIRGLLLLQDEDVSPVQHCSVNVFQLWQRLLHTTDKPRIQIRELFSGCVAVGLSKNEHLNSSALVAMNRFCDERGLPSVLQNTKVSIVDKMIVKGQTVFANVTIESRRVYRMQ